MITQLLLLPPDDTDIDRIVYYHVTICPVKKCRHDDCPVKHTSGRVRYHKCKKCGHPFKSVPAPRQLPDSGNDNA